VNACETSSTINDGSLGGSEPELADARGRRDGLPAALCAHGTLQVLSGSAAGNYSASFSLALLLVLRLLDQRIECHSEALE
jgi:hypothetical protein